jgi:serine protease AprX
VSQLIAAIDWVIQHRRDNGLTIWVLNLSLGTDSTQPSTWTAAVRGRGLGRGRAVVAAAPHLTPTSSRPADHQQQAAGRVHRPAQGPAAWTWPRPTRPPPRTGSQRFTPATGTGSLELARGTSHLADGTIELRGEQDIFGVPSDSRAWAAKSLAGTSWTGGSFNRSGWTGTSWSGATWPGRRWSGRMWSTGLDT